MGQLIGVPSASAILEGEPERVMTFPRCAVESLVPERGLRVDLGFWPTVIADGFASYPWRHLVENNCNFKHVATYCLCWIDIDGVRHYLTYRRGPKGEGESRLEGLYSLGVGGHVNAGDRGPLRAASRELQEEYPAGYSRCRSLRLMGVINDDISDDVGKVHLGALAVAEISMPCFGDTSELILGECGLREAKWRAADEIRADLTGKLESWSQILVEAIERGELPGG